MSLYSIVFAGVGGQGVITAAGLLARAAVGAGLELRMYGNYGMAQRGGSVSAHLRIGKGVLNARIEKGGANLLLGLELLETARNLPLLSRKGILVAHDALVPPAGKLPGNARESIVELLRQHFKGANIFDAVRVAGPSGPKGINAVFLGAATAAKGFPVSPEHIEDCIRNDFGGGADPVIEAFRRGREARK